MAKKKLKEPKPRNFGSEMQAISQYAQESAKAQAEQAAKLNQQYIDQALAATGQIAGKLDNSYTAQARQQLAGAGTAVDQLGGYAARLGALSSQAEGDVAGTDIERVLQQQALQDLQLGRSLSPEQERQATQQARAGMSARGLGVGTSAALAEVLNRDAYATAREGQRREFAGNVNQMQTGNRIQRLGAAGSLLGQTAGVLQNQAASRMGLAQAQIGIDPYARALGSSIPIASQGTSASLVGNSFGQAMQYGSDLYNTNFNADWSNYWNRKNMELASKQPAAPSGMFARMMAGASAGGQIGGFYGALGGAFDGATNGPIYQQYAKQTGAPK